MKIKEKVFKTQEGLYQVRNVETGVVYSEKCHSYEEALELMETNYEVDSESHNHMIDAIQILTGERYE